MVAVVEVAIDDDTDELSGHEDEAAESDDDEHELWQWSDEQDDDEAKVCLALDVVCLITLLFLGVSLSCTWKCLVVAGSSWLAWFAWLARCCWRRERRPTTGAVVASTGRRLPDQPADLSGSRRPMTGKPPASWWSSWTISNTWLWSSCTFEVLALVDEGSCW